MCYIVTVYFKNVSIYILINYLNLLLYSFEEINVHLPTN